MIGLVSPERGAASSGVMLFGEAIRRPLTGQQGLISYVSNVQCWPGYATGERTPRSPTLDPPRYIPSLAPESTIPPNVDLHDGFVLTTLT